MVLKARSPRLSGGICLASGKGLMLCQLWQKGKAGASRRKKNGRELDTL